jgi:hypothetical protein
MSDRKRPLDDEYEEILEESDDAIIGLALRRSLLVLAAIAVLVVAVVLWRRAPEDAAPETAIERQAPRAVEAVGVAPPARFVDVTSEAGIAFEHENGARGEKLLPETMGSGVAFFDHNGDGAQDLLLVNARRWLHDSAAGRAATTVLYENDGAGRFIDVSRDVGLDVSLFGTGVAVGDYDGDGALDVFLAALGANRLYRNTGGRFEDVTGAAGVAGADDAWSTSAAFFDADRDGDLDLFVVNYVRWSREIDFAVDFQLTGVGRAYGPPFNYEGTFSYLYRNEGDGTFTDVSEQSGIQIRNEATGVPVGKGLGLVTIDVDRDGWTDVFVANDTVRNFLFRNEGDGTFEEVGEYWGVAYGRNGEATGAMGVDAAQFRDDEELGLAIGNFANEMTSFYLSQGDPTLYADEAIGEGIGAASRAALSFGIQFLDYDLDGRLDLLQVNGHLEEEINTVDPSQTYEQSAQLFWNSGRGFVVLAADDLGALATPVVGRGSAVADIDADGDQDVVVTQAGRAPLLLRNDTPSGSHWLRVELRAPAPNRYGLGARVELRADGRTQRRVVTPTRSYLSQSEMPPVFGLGASERVDSLVVVWPDGRRQEAIVEGVDRVVVVTYRPDSGE